MSDVIEGLKNHNTSAAKDFIVSRIRENSLERAGPLLQVHVPTLDAASNRSDTLPIIRVA
jgi:hypothetical protein